MKIALFILSIIAYMFLSAGYFIWSYQNINATVVPLWGLLLSYGFTLFAWIVITGVIYTLVDQ